MPPTPLPSRRLVFAGALLLPALATPALAAARTLAFAVHRNGAKIGEHRLTLEGGGDAMTATAEAVMTVRLGPVPVFRYRHRAVERWAGGRFSTLRTDTNTNGRTQTVSAERTAGGVRIDGDAGRLMAPGTISPLTHWNPAIFEGPLFNPQDGKLLNVRATRAGPGRWSLRGAVEIDDVYDADGTWRSLRGKLEDGSRIEYRRL